MAAHPVADPLRREVTRRVERGVSSPLSLDGSQMLKVRLWRAPRRERARVEDSPRRVRVNPSPSFLRRPQMRLWRAGRMCTVA